MMAREASPHSLLDLAFFVLAPHDYGIQFHAFKAAVGVEPNSDSIRVNHTSCQHISCLHLSFRLLLQCEISDSAFCNIFSERVSSIAQVSVKQDRCFREIRRERQRSCSRSLELSVCRV